MTQDYVFSKQTQKELTKLFTRTLNIEGAAPIKLSEDEARDLISVPNYIVATLFTPLACRYAQEWTVRRFQGVRGTVTLAQHLFRDDYRRFITNQDEAELVSHAVRAMIGSTPTVYCCADCSHKSRKH